MTCLANIDVVILCGGKGSRLASVIPPDTPKCLAPINGRPFLDYLVDYLVSYGAKRIVLCTGHLFAPIFMWAAKRDDIEFVISHELRPLNTLGALRHARPHFRTERILVCNGDTLVQTDLSEFVARAHAVGVSDLHLKRFGSTRHYGSSGFRLMWTHTLDLMPTKNARLAPDGGGVKLEKILPEFSTAVRVEKGFYYDIGEPGPYRRAGRIFAGFR